MENNDALNQILAKLNELEKFQEETREEFKSNKEFQEETREEFKSNKVFQEETRKEFVDVKNEQTKIYELLLVTSERVSEPLDNIEALSSRVRNTEKNISQMQRRTGLK